MLPLIVTLPSESKDKAPCCPFTPSSSIVPSPSGRKPVSIVSCTIWPLELMLDVKDVLPKANAIIPTLARCTVMP